MSLERGTVLLRRPSLHIGHPEAAREKLKAWLNVGRDPKHGPIFKVTGVVRIGRQPAYMHYGWVQMIQKAALMDGSGENNRSAGDTQAVRPSLLASCQCGHERRGHSMLVGHCKHCECEAFEDAAERLPYWVGLGVRLRQPETLLFKRLVDTAVEEARDVANGLPTDDAVAAVDWLLTRRTTPDDGVEQYLCCMESCSEVLEVDVLRLRGNIRRYLGGDVVRAATEDRERVAAVLAALIPGDEAQVFESPRFVPKVDQDSLFDLEDAA